MRNLITDVAGVRVGNAEDASLGSGVTTIIFDRAVTGSVDVRGGGPGTRETALLDPAQTVEGIDAIVLSGGSAFGLDAASGVQAWLREQGRGFHIRDAVVPIVPAAIMFDLLNGGDKNWGRYPPYRDLGYAAAAAAASADLKLGSVGAGLGATTATLKGGLGSASAQTRGGITVGALAAPGGGFFDRIRDASDVGLLREPRTPYGDNCDAAVFFARLRRASREPAFEGVAARALDRVASLAARHGPDAARWLLAAREVSIR